MHFDILTIDQWAEVSPIPPPGRVVLPHGVAPHPGHEMPRSTAVMTRGLIWPQRSGMDQNL